MLFYKRKGVYMKKIIIFLILLPCILIAAQESETKGQDNEITAQKKPGKVEKVEKRADYMSEKVEYYKSVVESVKFEEEELKRMKKQSLADIKRNKY